MISNICKIEKGTSDLSAILNESKKVAVYNELDEKQTLQLRLICEELDGMLPNIIDEFSGEFWIEFTNGVCKVIASVCFEEFTAEKKKELVKLSTYKKNACAVGLVGKIRSVIEDLVLDDEVSKKYDMAMMFNSAMEYSVGTDTTCCWSLNKYRNTESNQTTKDWDELEKSIVANLADDIIVGVKGKQATISVVKNFKRG